MVNNDKAEFRDYIRKILTANGVDSDLFVDTQVELIVNMAKRAFSSKNEDISEDNLADIDAIYAEYPTKCVVSGRCTGKSASDKKKIERILREKTKEHVIATIRRYIEDCKRDKVYMKNFATFLNNLPDFDLTEKPKTVEVGGYRDLRKITEAQ